MPFVGHVGLAFDALEEGLVDLREEGVSLGFGIDACQIDAVCDLESVAVDRFSACDETFLEWNFAGEGQGGFEVWEEIDSLDGALFTSTEDKVAAAGEGFADRVEGFTPDHDRVPSR